MMMIENKQELLNWAKEVNVTAGSSKRHCDLQDVFARSSIEGLRNWYLEFEGFDKQLVTFSIIKSQGEEVGFRFLKAWAYKQANICIEEYQKEYEKDVEKLYQERVIFRKEKELQEGINKDIQAESARMNQELKRLLGIIEQLNNTVSCQSMKISELESVVNEAYTEMEKINVFKNTIRGILKEVKL